jgi:hypothetical protein
MAAVYADGEGAFDPANFDSPEEAEEFTRHHVEYEKNEAPHRTCDCETAPNCPHNM